MFWVIFDTSTRRDYYRDVHNLLALPQGGTIRYDYNSVHLSDAAINQTKADEAARPAQVLLAYAQDVHFQKGGADRVGVLPSQGTLWIATRFATLRHLSLQVDRYYFDLEAVSYPSADSDALMRILGPLIAASDVPFQKWVTVSDADRDFDLLAAGDPAANWSSLVDRIGAAPSQFAGDSFWRIARILNGSDGVPVEPTLEPHTVQQGGQRVITGVHAIYPVRELDPLAFEIESRTPGPSREPAEAEPIAPRIISLATATDGPLAGLNEKTVILRRYATDRVETEIGGTDRVDEHPVDLRLTTGPDSAGFPVGPELELQFRITKKTGRRYFALLFAIIAVIAVPAGASFLNDHPVLGVVLIGLGVLCGVVAAYLWTGKVKLPGAQN